MSEGGNKLNQTEIIEWFSNSIAEILDIEPGKVDPDADFRDFNLDSSAAIGLTNALGRELGMELEPVLLYSYPTIQSLSEHLTQ